MHPKRSKQVLLNVFKGCCLVPWWEELNVFIVVNHNKVKWIGVSNIGEDIASQKGQPLPCSIKAIKFTWLSSFWSSSRLFEAMLIHDVPTGHNA